MVLKERLIVIVLSYQPFGLVAAIEILAEISRKITVAL
jgi:hypothetical protein